MYSSIGVAGKMSLALAEAGINIRMLIQGCREINIIAGWTEKSTKRQSRRYIIRFYVNLYKILMPFQG